MKQTAAIITCEHASARIPAALKIWIPEWEDLLHAHTTFDIGAISLAREIANQGRYPLFEASVSRLIVDLNRSLNHRSLHSQFLRNAPPDLKQRIIDKYYLPYRQAVEGEIRRLLKKRKKVIHLSIHTFTPVLNGVARNCDIGLLYDPASTMEKEVAHKLTFALNAIKKNFPRNKGKVSFPLRIRKNYPYRGIADGFTTYLRRSFSRNYAGLELEINQALVMRKDWATLRSAISDSIHFLLSS